MSEVLKYFSTFAHRILPQDYILMFVFIVLLVGASIFGMSFRKKHYNLIGMRKYFFTFSGVLVCICLASLLINGFHLLPGAKLNFSLEFTGGTILELGYMKQDVTSDMIRDAVMQKYNPELQGIKLKEPLVQMVGTPRAVEYPDKYAEVTLDIKTRDGSDMQGEQLKGILTPLVESFGKTVLLEQNVPSGKEVKIKLGFSKPDFGKAPAATPSPDSGPDMVKSDRERVQAALSVYDPRLELVDMVVGSQVTIPAPSVQYKVAIIRISKEDNKNLSSDDVFNLMAFFSREFGNVYKFKIESIGPVIGGELKQKALLAIIIALLIQFIYITLRFGNLPRFGMAADIALLHDLIVMVGIYSIVGRPIDSPFLAALLTVIGYSVMDSIVIFDRIRENLKIFKKETYEQTVNISVCQTMTRSINTLLTVLLCLFALFFFGGETLKNFAFALLVGCTTGAYSSIFVASPILVLVDDWVKRKEQERVATRRAALAAAAQAKADRTKEQKKEAVPEKPKPQDDVVSEPEAEDATEKPRKKVKSKQRRRYNKLAGKKK